LSGLSPTIAVTTGDPAGIGPDICLRLLDDARAPRFGARIVVLADRSLLAERSAALNLTVSLRDWNPSLPAQPGTLDVLHLPLSAAARPGCLDPANAPYVLALLDRALAGCLSGEFAAMVTAPVHKGVINDAGIPFTGHTEYLAERTGTRRVVMMLAGGGLRVALVTTHLPLKDVPAAVTAPRLTRRLRILHREMGSKYGIAAATHPGGRAQSACWRRRLPGPRRNRRDHPGARQAACRRGMTLLGPLPADTMFSPPVLARGDCVLAMYHDQGLTALKYASFGHGINVTLGLPIIRTSVDHGTALELAGSGQADPGSLLVAIEQAIEMVKRAS
jgi:4-hydroxythreonine-4-phosphate dehydrogenase